MDQQPGRDAVIPRIGEPEYTDEMPADCEGGFWMRFYIAIALKIHTSGYFAEDPVLRISGKVLNLITLFARTTLSSPEEMPMLSTVLDAW